MAVPPESRPDVPSDPRPDALPTRRQLARILGLPERASVQALIRAGDRLVRALERRRRAAPHDVALAEEIATLEAALARHTAHARGGPLSEPGRARALGLALLVGFGALIVVLSLRPPPSEDGSADGAVLTPRRLGPARITILGALGEAQLRVWDADRRNVLRALRAQDASLELARGRYALEVSDTACDEPWTRSVYLEAGGRYAYEPTLCSSRGKLAIRANVAKARIWIDGEEIPPSAPRPVELSAGQHVVRLEKPGHRPFESTVEIQPGRQATLRADLLPRTPTHSAEQAGRLGRSLAAELEKDFEASAARPEPFDLGSLREEIAPDLERSAPSDAFRPGTALDSAGSIDWHVRVQREFLRRFDADGSGAIDRAEESDSIPCSFWRTTEASFERGGLGLSMAHYYGFDGSEWHPGALGFARSLRGIAYERMRSCGLQA